MNESVGQLILVLGVLLILGALVVAGYVFIPKVWTGTLEPYILDFFNSRKS